VVSYLFWLRRMIVAPAGNGGRELFSDFPPGVAIAPLKRLKTAKEIIWVFLPRVLVLSQGLDYPFSDLDFPSARFGNLSSRRKGRASYGVAESGA
jgi:hypothetical protein